MTRFQRVILLLLTSGLLLAQNLAADDGVVVFVYHGIGERQHPETNVRMDQFQKHLDHLRDGGFAVVPLADVIAFISDNRPLPRKAVAITIDDARHSVYQRAWPLLSEYGFPFTVFVSADLLDNGSATHLNWDQVREMAADGVTFSNHGAAHVSMVERLAGETEQDWQKRIVTDVEKGARRLQQEVSASDRVLKGVFAYPYGEYNTVIAERVAELGYIAFGQQSGAIGRSSDKRILPRFPMSENAAGLGSFRTKSTSLPLPVTNIEPWDPVTTDSFPKLTLTLDETTGSFEGLDCYLSGQGKARPVWLESNRRFFVSPGEALQAGRQQVVCVMPRKDGRYYWFGYQWVVQ